MRIRGGVTSHGFAVNVDSDLDVYERFTACRLPGVTMTSLRRMADAAGSPPPTDAAVRDAVAHRLGAADLAATSGKLLPQTALKTATSPKLRQDQRL
jgi:lipoyl(octanoyl) transferase